MEQTEPLDKRLKMVEMHSFFLEKINSSIDEENFFEASWLIYSCIENRFFRVLDKYKRKCKYCVKGGKCRKGSNQLALSTKLACVERLVKVGEASVADSFNLELLADTRAWVKRRNGLMHDLLALETYEEKFDNDFRSLALDGREVLRRIYSSCETFRVKFFTPGYEFVFPVECMEKCACKPRDSSDSE